MLTKGLTVTFSVCVNEGQDKLPTMYWLTKLHKRPYKAKFIANLSSCTTTELSKLSTSSLTAIQSHVIRYCETVYETSILTHLAYIANGRKRVILCNNFTGRISVTLLCGVCDVSYHTKQR